jgi:hypothetical protein
VESAHNLQERGWKGEIPTRVKRSSGGWRGVIYSIVDS